MFKNSGTGILPVCLKNQLQRTGETPVPLSIGGRNV